MQALKALGLALLLPTLPVLAKPNWSDVDLGEFSVPAACPGVALVAPAQAPQQQKQQKQQQQQQQQQQQVAIWGSGKVKLSMRAWPDRLLRDRQSIKAFDACAKAVLPRVTAAQLVGTERTAEEALKVAINLCLIERQQPFSARTVVLSRGSTLCPE